jgi:choline dehydrogenase-like flavoprotein
VTTSGTTADSGLAQLPRAADVIVVGAGLAGLALARRLAVSHSGRVLVVESGPDAGRDHYRWENDPERANALWLDPAADPHLSRPYRPTDAGYRGIAGLRRRLGGRSLYWGGVAVPIEPWALNEESWPPSVVAELTTCWRGGPSLYERVTKELTEWADGPLTTDRGFALGRHRFTEAPKAVRESAAGARWRAYSPLDDWPESVPLVCGHHAVAVVTDQDGVAGLVVERAGERVTIDARRIVLAAGTIENSRLVLQALPRTDSTSDSTSHAAPAALPGLVDKVAQGFVTAFDPAAAPAALRDVTEPGGLFLQRADARLRSSLFVRTYVNAHGLVVVDCYCMGEQTRAATGRVWCEPGPRLPWPTFVAGGLCPADELLVSAQRRELRQLYELLCQDAGVAGTGADLEFEDAFGSADLAGALVAGDGAVVPGRPTTYAFPLGSEQHEAGTLPLGGAVVDEHARVRAVPGLYVCGPATFPRTGAANPALTVLALATRLAGDLADQDPATPAPATAPAPAQKPAAVPAPHRTHRHVPPPGDLTTGRRTR